MISPQPTKKKTVGDWFLALEDARLPKNVKWTIAFKAWDKSKRGDVVDLNQLIESQGACKNIG